MKKEENEQLNKMFNATHKLLSTEGIELTAEQREQFENIQAQLAGAILSKWLPADWTRRIIMFVIFLVTLYLASTINMWFILLLIIEGIFSPRIVGKMAIFIGKTKGNK